MIVQFSCVQMLSIELPSRARRLSEFAIGSTVQGPALRVSNTFA
jgi:hypothetical protein